MSAKKAPVNPQETVHHESARKKRRAASGGAGTVNMTPMIDVTFLLLIFFIVGTNFNPPEGVLASKLPEVDPNNAPPPRAPLEIALQPVTGDKPGEVSARVLVNNQEVPGGVADLASVLNSMHGAFPPDDPSTAVIIKPAANVPWQFVLQAYNLTLVSGYRQVSWMISG
ncbi:MAG: hypothetical protein BIFFINMI_01111 [Phycisphaerae bacterium]|nr:hypothetical protein [Phycisphaerae bacterium]